MERSVRRRSVPRPPTPLQPQPDKTADACAGERGYREKVLAIDFPASEREGFVRGFERSFATNVAEGKALSAEFIRVERDISKTILTITNLVEMERKRVKLGTDGQTLLFEDNETKGSI
jgi:hypothetical protein